MRNPKTPWNRSYKGAQADLADDIAKQQRRNRRNRQQSAKQKYSAAFWDHHFHIEHGNVRPARVPHPDDKALGDARRRAEEAQDYKRLMAELGEVWE